MTRKSRRELEHAINDLATGADGDPKRSEITEGERNAIQTALEYYYDNYDTAAGDPDGDEPDRRMFFQNTAEHVEEPHATTLQRMLSDKEKRNA